MALSMTLVVLCPNGRRQQVKVSPNSSVLEVLEEACKKQGLNPDDYDIRHYSRRLDLSLSVRFANLPNNALLELNPVERVRHETEVTVALQLESGERLISDFPPSSSLHDVIQKCIGSRGEPMEKDEPAAEPVCVYMRQQFAGDQLKTVTLRSLGLTSGKTILRLMYRPLESLTEQAHIAPPLVKSSPVEDPTSRKSLASESSESVVRKQPRLDSGTWENIPECSSSSSGFSVAESHISNQNSVSKNQMYRFGESMQTDSNFSVSPSDQANQHASYPESNVLPDSETMECESIQEPIEEIGEIKYLGPRNAVLFNLEDISEVKKEDFPPEFFELTLNDIHYLMEEYKRTREELENEPLMLKSQREAQLLQHLTCYKQTVIRIYFPDKLVLQGTFLIDETVQSVKDFVRNFLEDQHLEFYLYITPPKLELPPEKSLLEAKLVPAAVVYFGCDAQSRTYLHHNFINQVSDPRAAWKIAAEHRQKSDSCKTCEPLKLRPEAVIIESSEVPSFPTQEMNKERSMPRVIPAEKQGITPKWFKQGNK